MPTDPAAFPSPATTRSPAQLRNVGFHLCRSKHVYPIVALALVSWGMCVGCNRFDPQGIENMTVTIWLEVLTISEDGPADVKLEIPSREESRQWACRFDELTETADPMGAEAVMRFEFHDRKGHTTSWDVLYGFEEAVACSTGKSYAAPPDFKAELLRLVAKYGEEDWCTMLRQSGTDEGG